jgi:hypothetical protein
MAKKPIWKGSILDTYNGNDKFGGRENDDVKVVDKAKGVDFIYKLIGGVESVNGFTTNLDPFNHNPTDFNMVNIATKNTNPPFDVLSTNVGFTWDGISGISPFNVKKTYRKTVAPK